MHLDVLDLRTFYYRTQLGRAAQRAMRAQLAELWPAAKGQTVVGFGFAVPLLRPLMGEARRTIALMPGQQGVMPWPAGLPNLSVLCEETLWPLESGMADKLVVLHGLETSEQPSALLDECWRVLTPEGRGIFIVPNRAGLWARRDRTPFGFGRPYSLGQLEALLTAHGLTPARNGGALYLPPSEANFWLRTGALVERMGQTISGRYASGVLIVEVIKQVPQPKKPGLREAVTRPLRVLDAIGQPGAKPI